MARKNLIKSESAAAIAIAAVLLLGLAFTIISVVKLNYVPEWKIDAERDYSYNAWSSMEDVKTRTEIFTRFMNSDVNYPEGLSTTVPFHMGGGDIPVFEPSKSNSMLAVNNENCTMSISFGNHSFNETCGGITYCSENRRYPDQVFRYENGALILAQSNNSQMKRGPSFNITKNMSNYTVTFNAVNLTGKNESFSSSTLTALRLTGRSIGPVVNTDPKADGVIKSFNLSISTHYTDAWANYFNSTAKDAGLEYDTDYKITYPNSGCVCLSFLSTGNKTYDIHVNKTVLYAELGMKEGGFLLGETSGSTNENPMKKSIWYYFDSISDLSYKQYLNYLKDCNSGFNLSINSTGQNLNSYTNSSNVLPFSLNNNPSELTFRFSNFTTFESSPSSVTLVMIYRPTANNPAYQNMSIAGKSIPKLTGNSASNWYLYNQTVNVTGMSISSPSDLGLYINIGKENNKYINIDYLAIRLN